MFIDKDLLSYYLKKANTNQNGLALELGIDRTTLIRHLAKGTLTLGELYATIKFLKLSDEDVKRIFFAKEVAEMLPEAAG